MNPMLIGALAGGGIGLLTHGDKKRQIDAQNKAAVVQTRMSPWSGMGMGQIQQGPSLLGDVAGGALSGASFVGDNKSMFGGGATEKVGADAMGAAAETAVAEKAALPKLEMPKGVLGPSVIDNEKFSTPWNAMSRLQANNSVMNLGNKSYTN